MAQEQATKKETFGFQTEVKQLLHLMIHSLYSNKEIFLRELISNSSDAVDKLRFQAIANPKLTEEDPEFAIVVDYDKDAGLLSISDNGIGMSREEVVDHLGTIAKSGTRAFVESLSGDQAKDSKLIGQFGVGFYSAFMVADKVVVNTRRADLSAEEGVRWESQGEGEYTLETLTKPSRGTEVILHLKKDEQGLLDSFALKNIITRYSDHIAIPIKLREEKTIESEGDDKDAEPATEITYEPVNTAKALWLRSKSEIKDEEYKEFYRHVSHDYGDPLAWTHNKVEGKQEFTNLLYIPKSAPFDLWDREKKSGIKLYIQRVFIMDNADVMPAYLRFVKGVIDSADLPLNVSREILQQNALVDKIRAASVKKVLSTLEKMAKNKPEDYKTFWNAFGQVMKEGPAEDFENKETIAKLLRFASTYTDTAEQTTSLEDYVSRMSKDQKAIYFITADSFLSAKNSPHLEIFRKKGIEVLLLSDRVDEWLTSNMMEFDGKPLKSVTVGELDLGDETESEEKKEEKEKIEKDFEAVIQQMKEALGDKVKEIRMTDRLTDSPSCVVADDSGMSMHLQRLMASAGQNMPASAPILELNPEHDFVMKLKDEQDDQRFKDWSEILLDQALLTEAGSLADPSSFVKLVNKYL